MLPPLPTFPDSVEQTPSASLPINQDFTQPVRLAKELLSAADKNPTTKKTASTLLAPIIYWTRKEVRAMRDWAIPKNTRKSTNWATTVWIDRTIAGVNTEYRRSAAQLPCCLI